MDSLLPLGFWNSHKAFRRYSRHHSIGLGQQHWRYIEYKSPSPRMIVYDSILPFSLDAVSNVTMARQGFPRMAIGACFGGPLLSILY